mgnify:CR=1 FL=1
MAKKKRKNSVFLLILLIATILLSIVFIKKSVHILYCAAYPIKYSEYVEKYTELYQVEDDLVYAVIRSESRFNPDAVSEIGACGLMQITQDTFDWAKSRMDKDDGATYEDIFDPEINIKYGTYILYLLLDEFPDERTAVAAYHAGWGNMKQWLNNPEHSNNGSTIDSIPFDDTNAYVNQVLESQQIYQELYYM